MEWLLNGIKRLLETDRPINSSEYQEAYDDCIWRIATSNKDDLQLVVNKIWSEYADLPIPIKCIIARICGSESSDNNVKTTANAIIEMYCDPEEHLAATEGFSLTRK